MDANEKAIGEELILQVEEEERGTPDGCPA